LCQRGARNGHKGHVAVIEVNTDAVEVVGPERAGLAPFLVIGTEHKVIDDELAPFLEELGQRLLAQGTVEDVLLVNSLPWELAPLSAQFVPQSGEFLFLREER